MKEKLVWAGIGALGYYGFLKFTGVISGAPWRPSAAVRASQ